MNIADAQVHIEDFYKNSLLTFNKQQKSKAISFHKYTIALFSVINAVFFVFILCYNYYISLTDEKIINFKNELKNITESNGKIDSIVSKRFVNLKAKLNLDKAYLTEIFQSKYEFLELIYKINYYTPSSFKYSYTLCYHSHFNGDSPESFYKNCRFDYLLIVIETKKDKRFALFTSKGPQYNETYEYKEDPNAFIYSIDSNQTYHIELKQSNEAIKYEKDSFFIFGKGDFVINSGFKHGIKSYCGYPLSFSSPDEGLKGLNVLTGGEKVFEIKRMEVFGFFPLFYDSDT